MAINKKLIHFQTMANFEAQLSAGNILDTSIVFIKDAKKIWTHGEFYDCAGGITVETDPIFSASPAATITEAKKSEWDSKMDKVTLAAVATSGSYNDLSNKPTIPDVSNKQDKVKCFNITPPTTEPLIIRPENNSYYSITNLANDIYVFLPDLLTPVYHVEHIMLNVKFGSTPNIQFIPGAGYGGTVRAAESFSIEPDSWYEISIINAGNGWIVSNIKLNDAIINPILPSGNPTAVSSEEDDNPDDNGHIEEK